MPATQVPADNVLNNGGVLDPLEFKRHRALEVDGFVLDPVPANTRTWVVNIAGCLLYRLRGKIAGANGTLSFLYRRPPPKADQSYSNAVVPARANLAVVGGTEFSADILPGGESLLAITWTPTGASTVTFLDHSFQ